MFNIFIIFFIVFKLLFPVFWIIVLLINNFYFVFMLINKPLINFIHIFFFYLFIFIHKKYLKIFFWKIFSLSFESKQKQIKSNQNNTTTKKAKIKNENNQKKVVYTSKFKTRLNWMLCSFWLPFFVETLFFFWFLPPPLASIFAGHQTVCVC